MKGIIITNAQCIIDQSQASLSFSIALHWLLPYTFLAWALL